MTAVVVLIVAAVLAALGYGAVVLVRGSGRNRGYKFRGALSLEKLIAGEAMNNTSDCGGPNGVE
jgi:hypothetical protein